MVRIEILKATPSDVLILKDISEKTFIEAFGELNTTENMNIYINSRFNIEQLKIEMGEADSEFYFAQLNRKVIGYLKINFQNAQTEIKDKRSLEIERIYVLNEFQRIKVGQQLFDKALNIAKQMNMCFLWLGVWEKNQKAIHFYKKNGFVTFDKHIFKLGHDLQIDILMRLDLR